MRPLYIFLTCALLCSCHAQKSAATEEVSVATVATSTQTSYNDSTRIYRDLFSLSTADSITATFRADSIKAGGSTIIAPDFSVTWHRPARINQSAEDSTGTQATDIARDVSSIENTQKNAEQNVDSVMVADPPNSNWLIGTCAGIAIAVLILWQIIRRINGIK